MRNLKTFADFYNYIGHSLDTINYNFLSSVAEGTCSFYSVHFAYFWQKVAISQKTQKKQKSVYS